MPEPIRLHPSAVLFTDQDFKQIAPDQTPSEGQGGPSSSRSASGGCGKHCCRMKGLQALAAACIHSVQTSPAPAPFGEQSVPPEGEGGQGIMNVLTQKKAQQWAVASGGLSSRTISESHCQATVRTCRVNTRQLSHLVACS